MVLWNKLYPSLFLSFFLLAAGPSKGKTVEQQLKIELRSIAHEFLMQLNDSTSRILPIEKQGNRYAIEFDREFVFEPEQLIHATYAVMKKSTDDWSYVVEVEKCGTGELVHSFEATSTKKQGTIACKERALQMGCYILYFTPSSLVHGELVAENDSLSTLLLLLISLVLLISIFYGIKRWKRTNTASELINIGQFHYDPKGMTLSLKTELIELSSKESDLLFLLFSNENKTLQREYILKEVWGDDGDYVGRTLDVFISKLRKKLEADASLSIINARGIGYRFVMKKVTSKN